MRVADRRDFTRQSAQKSRRRSTRTSLRISETTVIAAANPEDPSLRGDNATVLFDV